MQTSELVTGQAPNKYRFLGKLGAGGMAEVFVAVTDQAPGFHKLLVLKLLREALPENQDSVAAFMDEARLAARLNHRNIVQTYEVGQIEGRHAIVMEFLEGVSLARLRRLAQGKFTPQRLPLAESLYILSEALAGLHYAHELRDFDGSPLCFVHRDFSPANLMVTLDGQIKVLDFGVAKTRASLSQTRNGIIKGTARYMARETILGLPIDRRSDVYMAGAVLWQLIAGRAPWSEHEEMAVLYAAARERLPALRTLDPAVPEALEAIVLRATDPDPQARFASASELRDELVKFAREASLVSDPDRVAALVRQLAGSECQQLRRRIDDQLAQASTSPHAALAFLGNSSSTSLAPEAASNSRIRATAEGSSLRRRARTPLLLSAAALIIALAVHLLSTRESASDAPRSTPLLQPRVAAQPLSVPPIEVRADAPPTVSVPANGEKPSVEASSKKAHRDHAVMPAQPEPEEPTIRKLRDLPSEESASPAADSPAVRSIDRSNPWAQ